MHFADKSKTKVAAKQARLVRYELIKEKITEQMKVFTIEAIPNKSKAFHSIIELVFSLRLINQGRVPLVNENSEKMMPAGENNQIGNVLMRIIYEHNYPPTSKAASYTMLCKYVPKIPRSKNDPTSMRDSMATGVSL